MIELKMEIVTDLAAATSREWLETNGIGGYASGTVSGSNTRRYHGLLIAATKPPLGRVVLLSKMEETLVVGGERFELSSNQFPDAVHPNGYRYLTDFRLDPYPIWTYACDGVQLTKKVMMVHGQNSTVVIWRVNKSKSSDARDIHLEVRPLVAFRDYHQLRHEPDEFETEYGDGSVIIRSQGDLPPLYLSANSSSIEPTCYSYRNFEYAIEKERGFDYRENLFQPCQLSFDLLTEAVVIASTEPRDISLAKQVEKAEVKRRSQLIGKAGHKDKFSRQLVLAADQFIVDRGEGKTVIAGYHWFSDWGRDTMIALTGLTLATDRPDIAKSILSEFAGHLSQGMLPNRFPDVGVEPEYNTVDATLWFFEAVRAYLENTNDQDFVCDALYEKLVETIAWHVRGTRHNIHVDVDGLLYAGEPGVQLTWMDAKIGDWVVTPRTGKAVEIQSLWYNALRIMADLASRFGDAENQNKFSNMADIAAASFNGQFWNSEAMCLFDVVDGNEKDASIRPNQIFAVSLYYSMLDLEHSLKVVEKVEEHLLTPVGLRSLSPDDERYVAVYNGTPFERDSAYHQGTVWAWLIGPFIDAYRKTHSKDKDLDERVEQFTAGFRTHSTETMLGQVSEIFDAEPPHTARGCAAQAWSVAELLRILSPR